MCDRDVWAWKCPILALLHVDLTELYNQPCYSKITHIVYTY